MRQKYGRNFIVTCFVVKLFRGRPNGSVVKWLNCWIVGCGAGVR